MFDRWTSGANGVVQNHLGCQIRHRNREVVEWAGAVLFRGRGSRCRPRLLLKQEPRQKLPLLRRGQLRQVRPRPAHGPASSLTSPPAISWSSASTSSSESCSTFSRSCSAVCWSDGDEAPSAFAELNCSMTYTDRPAMLRPSMNFIVGTSTP